MALVPSWLARSRGSGAARITQSLLALVGLRAPTMAYAVKVNHGTATDSVVVEHISRLRSAALGNERTVDVYLPPGYAGDTTTRYAVIYANDGQDMPAAGLRETLQQLVDQHRIQPVIVVASHANDRRLQEYGTAGIPNAQGLGASAARYEQFLLEELMPFVEGRYRVLAGPEHTAIMGWSLGGLSAFDAAWTHPERFGTVGVFSGSFWWRTDDTSVATRQASRIMHRRVRDSAAKPGRLRCWFETGRQDESDDRDGNGVIDSIQDTEELMDELAVKGWRRDVDMVHVEVEGGHDVSTWGAALPAWLTWAFPAR
ncbi:MAG: alpha/beta hydrolase-fold protein [Gemmatimonadota bacterium]